MSRETVLIFSRLSDEASGCSAAMVATVLTHVYGWVRMLCYEQEGEGKSEIHGQIDRKRQSDID